MGCSCDDVHLARIMHASNISYPANIFFPGRRAPRNDHVRAPAAPRPHAAGGKKYGTSKENLTRKGYLSSKEGCARSGSSSFTCSGGKEFLIRKKYSTNLIAPAAPCLHAAEVRNI